MLSRKLMLWGCGLLAFLMAAGIFIVANLIGQLNATAEVRHDVTRLRQMTRLSLTAQKLQYDIVQVQQFLTDYSATRGLNGLDDGPGEAAKAAKDFDVQLSAAKTLASELDLPGITTRLDAMSASFPQYYAVGQKMSQAYVSSGTEAGNATMPEFDAAADHMVEVQNAALKEIKTAANAIDSNAISASNHSDQIAHAILWLTLLCGVLLTGACGALGLFIFRQILRPLAALSGYLEDDLSIRDGNHIPGLGRRDEIGAVASALRKSEHNALAWEEERHQQDRQIEQERKATTRRLAGQFERAVGGIIEHVSAAATELQASAHQLTSTAHETSTQSLAVTSAAEHAGSSLTSVASSAEELGASVSEIARQVDHSTSITRAAVTEAHRAAEVVAQLDVVASSVHGVVDMISALANQTNLLALNATIESARAGEAGKGFAVVATEVKQLAGRTAAATAEVSAKIAQIQTVSRNAVAVIQGISRTVAQVDDAGAAIAAAVDQQGAATREIISAMHEASIDAREVTSNISGVAAAAQHTGSAAAQLSLSSSDLADQAAILNTEMQTFIATIAA